MNLAQNGARDSVGLVGQPGVDGLVAAGSKILHAGTSAD
jgi:hypothetical protein